MRPIAWCIVLACVLGAGAPAQTTDSETLRALLTEVRQLRAAVEVFAAAVPQAQITFQRLQLQQQRVAQLSDQMNGLQRQIDDQVRRQSDLHRRFEDQREAAKGDTDASHRKEFEMVLKETKISLEQAAAIEQQLRVRSAELNTSLGREQAKLDDLEQQLARLEKSLAAVGDR